MMKFFRNKGDKIINATLFYIVGPVLLILFIYQALDNPSGLLETVHAPRRFDPPLMFGFVGGILTIAGIVRYFNNKH